MLLFVNIDVLLFFNQLYVDLLSILNECWKDFVRNFGSFEDIFKVSAIDVVC